MELFGRLTDASAALGEAKLCSAKGWALWQKVSSEKHAIQQELDAIREKNAQRDRQDKLDSVQAGVHHDNAKTSVARVQNEKAATEAELQQAQNAEAVATGKLRQAGIAAEETQNALAQKEGEVQALEVVSIRLMNQIEQLEEQGCTLLEEGNAAIAQTAALQEALAKNEAELETAKAWHDSTLEENGTSLPEWKQGTPAATVNLGPQVQVKQWEPLPQEQKYFGSSRMFPSTSAEESSSSSTSKAEAPPSSSASSLPSASLPDDNSDTALHHKAVMLNPLQCGDSGVDRQREIEKDFRMLKATRDREFNKAVGRSLDANRGVKGATTASSSAPATAPAPAASSSASDVELHQREVMANPIKHGGSEVERQIGIEKDFKMLKAARDKGLFPERTTMLTAG
jgi:hypothetical protein